MNILLIFEHYFEAKPFLENEKIKKIKSKNFFKFNNNDVEYYLFINHGKGYLSLLNKLYKLNDEYSFNMMINMGICGSLNKNYRIGEIFSIKRFINVDLNNNKILNPPILSSLFLEKNSKLITLNYIQEGNKKNWRYYGELLDLEGYFIAFFSKKNKIPFLSIKVISDYNKNIKNNLDKSVVKNLYNYFKKKLSFIGRIAEYSYYFEIVKRLNIPLKYSENIIELNKYFKKKDLSFTERSQIYNNIRIKFGNSIENYFEKREKQILRNNKEKGFLFIEKKIKNKKKYIDYFNNYDFQEIANYLDYFQYSNKDYRNIIVANKKGNVLKKKPDNYGKEGFSHYSITNGYNCPFNCSYCYLQGWLRSSDIVIFDNVSYIWKKIKLFLEKNKKEKVIFYFGDFFDALVYEELTQSIYFFSKKLKDYNNKYMEFRTKATVENLNIKNIHDNIIIGLSFSTRYVIKEYEMYTSSLEERIESLKYLNRNNISTSIHIDPIIYYKGFEEEYSNLVERIFENITDDNLFSLSIGSLRLTKKTYKSIKRNKYNAAVLKNLEFDSGMYRYPKKIRERIYKKLKMLINKKLKNDKFYICMDEVLYG